jgi:hypothetical protein
VTSDGRSEVQLELFGAPAAAETVEDQLRMFGPDNLDRVATPVLLDIATRSANGLRREPRQNIVNELARRAIPVTDWESTFRLRSYFGSLVNHGDLACRQTALPEIDPAEANPTVRSMLGGIAEQLARDTSPAVRSTVIARFVEPVCERSFWASKGSLAVLPEWVSAVEFARVLEGLAAHPYGEIAEGAKIGWAITVFVGTLREVGALERIVGALADHPLNHGFVAVRLGQWMDHLADHTVRRLLTRLAENRDPTFVAIWAVYEPVLSDQFDARTVPDAGGRVAREVLELDVAGEADSDDEADRAAGTGLCRRGADLSGRKLAGEDFTGVDLTNADFRGSNLTGAIFYRATLVGATFDRADLSGATLAGANLQRASFFATDASLANCIGADLRGANLTIGRFRGVNFQDADLRGARVDGLDVYGAHLTGSSRDEGFPTSC